MLLALSGLSVAAVAQNTTEVTEEVLEVVEVRQDKYAVVTNPFGIIGLSRLVMVLLYCLVIMMLPAVSASVSVLH